MELLYIKSKDPLMIESYVFDTVNDAAAYYTQHPHKHIFVGFLDENENKVLTFAENESQIDLYNKFIRGIINEETKVSHIFEDSSFSI